MKEVIRSFNDKDDKYKMRIATRNIPHLSDNYKNDLGNLANFYIFHAMDGIATFIPKTNNLNIYNEKTRIKSMCILYGISKALEIFNNEKKELDKDEYKKYLDLMTEEVYQLKQKNFKYKAICYDSGENLNESELFVDVLNTNKKLRSLELDENYLLKNISLLNQEYYDFIAIVHDLINQNMIMISRIRSNENIKIKKK